MCLNCDLPNNSTEPIVSVAGVQRKLQAGVGGVEEEAGGVGGGGHQGEWGEGAEDFKEE